MPSSGRYLKRHSLTVFGSSRDRTCSSSYLKTAYISLQPWMPTSGTLCRMCELEALKAHRAHFVDGWQSRDWFYQLLTFLRRSSLVSGFHNPCSELKSYGTMQMLLFQAQLPACLHSLNICNERSEQNVEKYSLIIFFFALMTFDSTIHPHFQALLESLI